MYKNISIDLETLSLQTNAAVIQIAAVPFNTCLTEGDNPKYNGIPITIDEIFNQRIHAGDILAPNYDISEETLAWWMKQDQVTRNLAFSGMSPPWQVAANFRNWIRQMQLDGKLAQGEELRVWIRNAPFDWHVLKNFLECEGQDFPFHHRSVREYYGIVDHAPAEVFSHIPANPMWHDAACDATHQAKMICAAQMFWATSTPAYDVMKPIYEQ